MILLGLIPLLTGYLLATRWLEQRRYLVIAALSLSLGTALTLLPLNGLLVAGFPLKKSLLGTLGLQVAASLGLLLGKKAPAGHWSRTQSWALLPVLLIYFLNLAIRLMAPDDDYFVHMPIQGSLQSGLFPPRNPFFIEIVMHGHYGRNLFLGGFSALLGCFSLFLEIVITPLWMAATYVLFWSALEEKAWSRWQNHLAPALIFFGVNCGHNSGLGVLPYNNNPIAYLYMALVFWLFCQHRQKMAWRVGVIWGLVLGGYAIVYETHFGLCVLATACVSLLLQPSWRRMGHLLLPALLAAGLAVTQGGPLTEIFQRKHHQTELSQGMQNNSQVVKLKFPKQEIFQIKLYSDKNPSARQSLFYQEFVPSAWRRLRPEAGYTSVFSWQFLQLHFLPTYLAPVTGWLLWKRRHSQGLWLWFFGLWAFLTPALVHFGPVYESEYMRWQVAAALCWSACLGLQIGWLSGHWRRLGVVLVGLCFLPALTQIQLHYEHFQRWPGPRHWLLLPPSTAAWMGLQGDPNFSQADFEMALALRQAAAPKDRILCTTTQENKITLLYESTLTGLTGVRCVGHSFPLDSEEIGLPPYFLAPAAQGFWQDQDPRQLAQMQVDWLLRRVAAGTKPLAGLTTPQIFSDGVVERQLYALKNLPAEAGNFVRQEAPRVERNLTLAGATSLRQGDIHELKLSRPLPYWTALVSEHDTQLSPRDWLWSPPGTRLTWMAPRAEGEFELQLWGRDAQGVFRIQDQHWRVKVDYHARVQALKPNLLRLKQSQALPRQIVEVEAQFEPSREHHDWLVALQFLPLQEQRRVDPNEGPQTRLQKVQPDEQGRLKIFGQVPQPAGNYSVTLVVSADGRECGRWDAGVVEVVP